MQFQADILGVPVVVPEMPHSTTLGAALLAAVGTNLTTLDQVQRGGSERARYEPDMSEDERRTLLEGWASALSRARGK
jgi:glycerol kinase